MAFAACKAAQVKVGFVIGMLCHNDDIKLGNDPMQACVVPRATASRALL